MLGVGSHTYNDEQFSSGIPHNYPATQIIFIGEIVHGNTEIDAAKLVVNIELKSIVVGNSVKSLYKVLKVD